MANLIWDVLKGAKYEGPNFCSVFFERLWMCSVGGPRSQLNYLPLMQCTLFRPQRTKDPSWRWGIIIFGRKTCGRGFCNTRDYYQYRRVSDSLTGLVSKKSGLEISWGSNCIYCGTNFSLFTNFLLFTSLYFGPVMFCPLKFTHLV